MNRKNRPKVGVGIIILNEDNRVLIGKRINIESPYFSIPGGHLELGESFEEAAIREVKEETSLDIIKPKVISVTNNLKSYLESGTHSVSVILIAENFRGTVRNLEPNKCLKWEWADINNLPQPHFDASEQGIKCYLKNKFYLMD